MCRLSLRTGIPGPAAELCECRHRPAPAELWPIEAFRPDRRLVRGRHSGWLVNLPGHRYSSRTGASLAAHDNRASVARLYRGCPAPADRWHDKVSISFSNL